MKTIARWPTGNPADSYVLLDYGDPSVRRTHHDEQRAQIADSRRCHLIAAEKAVSRLYVIVDCLDISPLGITRIYYALAAIEQALALKRKDLGMQQPVEALV